MRGDERRLRVRTALVVQLRLTSAQGEECDAQSVDISRAGMQIACDPRAAAIIAGSASVLGMQPGRQLQLTMESGQTVAVTTLWARRHSQLDYRFGLHFQQLSEPFIALLKRLVVEKGRPCD